MEHEAITHTICDRIIKWGLIFLIVFTPLAFGTVHTWSYTLMELTVIFLLLIWLLKVIVTGQNPKGASHLQLVSTPLNLPILLFILLILFQLLPLPPKLVKHLSPNTYNLYKMTLPGYDSESRKWKMASSTIDNRQSTIDNPQLTTDHWRPLSLYPHATRTELFKILAYVGVFFLIINNIQTRRELNTLITTIIVMGVVIASFGLIQMFTWNGGIYWFWKSKFWPHGSGKAFGPYVLSCHFAGYMEMAIPLALGILFARLQPVFKDIKEWRGRLLTLEARISKIVIILICIAIMTVAVFLSRTSAGIITTIFAFAFFAFFAGFPRSSRKRWTVLSVLALVLGASLIWAGPEPIFKELSTVQAIPRGRFVAWKDTLGMIKDFPLLGSSVGTFQYLHPKYKSAEIGTLFWEHAHNDYLELLSEMGVLGFLLVCTGMGFFFFRVAKLLQARKDPYVRGVTLGGLTAIAAILFHSLADFNLHIPANALLFSIILGMTFAGVHVRKIRGGDFSFLPGRTLPLGPKLRLAIFAATIALTIYLGVLPTRAYLAEKKFSNANSHWPEANGEWQTALSQSAIGHLQQAIALEPKDSRYHYYLGKCYEAMGLEEKVSLVRQREWFQKGKDKYQKAIALEPTNAWYHLNLGWILHQLPSGATNPGNSINPNNEFNLASMLDPQNPHITNYIEKWWQLPEMGSLITNNK